MYLFHFCWQHSGPSELGIVFKNHLKLLTQHDVPFGLQFATEEGLQRDRERAPTITLALTPFPRIQSSGHLLSTDCWCGTPCPPSPSPLLTLKIFTSPILKQSFTWCSNLSGQLFLFRPSLKWILPHFCPAVFLLKSLLSLMGPLRTYMWLSTFSGLKNPPLSCSLTVWLCHSDCFFLITFIWKLWIMYLYVHVFLNIGAVFNHTWTE